MTTNAIAVEGTQRKDGTRVLDARPNLPAPAIGAPYNAQIGQASGILIEDGRCLVARSVVHDRPERRLHGLRCHGVERATEISALIAARRDEQIASRGAGVLVLV